VVTEKIPISRYHIYRFLQPDCIKPSLILHHKILIDQLRFMSK